MIANRHQRYIGREPDRSDVHSVRGFLLAMAKYLGSRLSLHFQTRTSPDEPTANRLPSDDKAKAVA